MIDAVLSYHMNPQTCGVAKFNHLLAAKLGVPCLPFREFWNCAHPLISVKLSELGAAAFDKHGFEDDAERPYDLFLHDYMDWYRPFIVRANKVYVGNEAIAEAVHCLHADVVTGFCPSTVTGNPTRGQYRVLVFGMAHKLLLPHFENLKRILDAVHKGDYTIELSTAVHEGNPWDAALTESVTNMRAIFGERLRVLGFLGDDALAKELNEVDAVAAYYVPALRANNTSAWAAIEAGKVLFTNCDELSPPLVAPTWESLVSLING
jgi:hypothetical protein